MNKAIILSIIITMCSLTSVVGQSYKVIVNQANTTTTISSKDLSSMLLKKKKKWDNGTVVKPVDQKIDSAVRAEFTSTVHKKKVSSIRSYWQQAIFSGVATAPAEKSNDQEVIDYVKKNPGAVGYISANTSATGVNVLTLSN